MKIAIKANPDRGKEIISLLESLGGINTRWKGDGNLDTYYIDKDNKIQYNRAPADYKVYTLEEFEKEFPFKVGDKVITSYGNVGIIRSLTPDNDEIPYCIETEKRYIYRHQSELKLYKEMERSIKLTLEKAKEWYKKGGDLKQIALQAFTEEELTKIELPKTWKEFCKRYPIKKDESYINSEGKIISFTTKTTRKDWNHICPSQKSAEAHLAMIQLEQLRDCWRQGWEPKNDQFVYAIKFYIRGLEVYCISSREFLSFSTKEMALEFLECFRDLIEKAGDLI